MKLTLSWTEGRTERRTETDIPPNLSWEESKRYIEEALKKAYKYTDEELPKGITEADLQPRG